MSNQTYVIVGTSLARAKAADELRERLSSLVGELTT